VTDEARREDSTPTLIALKSELRSLDRQIAALQRQRATLSARYCQLWDEHDLAEMHRDDMARREASRGT